MIHNKEDPNRDWSQSEEHVLDVLDLPQLYQKPPANSLLSALDLLTLEPRSWDSSTIPSSPSSRRGATTPARKQKVRSDGVPQYLTRIISSRLAWLPDDQEKEDIWDTASMRLSERSGRTGMSDFTRTFRIPLANEPVNESSTMQPVITTSEQEEGERDVEINIFEPALTEDNLGLKTWASSYVLARKWHSLRDRLPSLSAAASPSDTILELGAGTGLVGLAAAAVLQANVLLTDLQEIVSNLQRNIHDNADAITERGGSSRAAVLDWTKPEEIKYFHSTESVESETDNDDAERKDPTSKQDSNTPNPSQFPLVVAADPIYSSNHPKWLVETINHHLTRSEDARAVVIIPIREAYGDERHDFRDRMKGVGLVLDFEETDIGYDDWSEGREDELKEVECWTSVWKWAE